MSQTPSQQRKVPIHILDDLSSKFIVNLVSRNTLFLFLLLPNFMRLCFAFFLLCVFFPAA